MPTKRHTPERNRNDFAVMSIAISSIASYLERGDFRIWLADRVLNHATSGILDNFVNARDPDTGEPWQPRAPRKDDDGHPLLIDTTKMLNAAAFGGPGSKTAVQRRQIDFDIDHSEVPYARVQQFGSQDEKQNIPARPYYGLNDQFIDGIAELAADGIMEEITQIIQRS